MIFVNRSTQEIPEFLLSEKVKAVKQRMVNLLSTSSAEHLDQLRVSFEGDIWQRARDPLRGLFRGKCAFCESKLTLQTGDVEHYRPRRGAGSEVRRSGHLFYSWLAYDWDNLLIICQECNFHRNRKVGSDEFRVMKKRAPFLSSVAECRRQETPYLIDPCFDEPLEHLECDRAGRLRALTARGNYTISILELNGREGLLSARRQAWAMAKFEIQMALDAASAISSSENVRRLSHNLEAVFDANEPHLIARRAAFREVAVDLLKRQDLRFELLRPLLTNAELARLESQTISMEAIPVQQTKTRWGRFPGKRDLPVFAQNRIAGISIRNFKGIEALDIEVPEGPDGPSGIPGALTLLGENASGKSSVLEAVALACLGTNQIARLDLDGQAFLRRETTSDAEQRHCAEVSVRLDDGYQVHLKIGDDGQFSGNEQPVSILLGYGPRRFFAHHRNVKRFSEPWHRVRSMFDPTVTLPNPSKWLLSCSQQHFNLAVRALRTLLVLPEQALVRRSTQPERGHEDIFFELNGRIEQLSQFSEGYKTVVAMGVDIMREMLEYFPDLEVARGTVLIDELDTHLHPRWKMRIANRLRTALPNVQFLTSTHDPLCLRGYYEGEVQVLRRGENARVERVLDLPNVRGLSVQQLLTSEFFGLYSAEDPQVDVSVARYAELIAKVDRTQAEEAELRRHREEAGRTLSLGSDPKGQLAQEAIGKYLLERRTVSTQRSHGLKREAMSKLRDVWDSLNSGAGHPPADDEDSQS